MRKMLSKIICALLLVSVFTTALPVTAGAAESPGTGTAFVFSEDGISVTEGSYDGYKIEGTELTINGSGSFVLSGSCSDGSVNVKKGTADVELVLAGLDLTSKLTAPLSCNKSTGVVIVAQEGTVNTLTDSRENNDDLYADNTDAENAVIKCKDGSRVTIGGTGTLNIVSSGKNGIKSGSTTEEEGEARLTIKDVTLNITAAVNDAVNAEAALDVLSGNITISAADDGLHSDQYMNIGASGSDGPTIKIEKCREGIEAATLKVYSGDISVYSADDCMNAANSDLSGYNFSIDIFGGNLYMVSSEGNNRSGDGIDSNGSLTISGGNIEVWTASTSDNQPLDADGSVVISGGTVLAAGSSGGMGMKLNASQPYVLFGGGSRNDAGNAPRGDNRNEPPDDRDDHRIQRAESVSSGMLVTSNSEFAITAEDGGNIYTGKAPCGAGMMIYSSPELIQDKQYKLTSDGTEAASATAATGNKDGSDPIGPGGGPTGPNRPTDAASTTAATSATATTAAATSATTETTSSTLNDVVVVGKEITRICGADRYATAVGISEKAFDSAENVVIACGGNYPDALAAAPPAYALDAPVLLAGGNSLSSDTLKEIERLGAKNIYIIGGESAVSDNIASSLSQTYNVTRISGSTRFETAVEAAKLLLEKKGSPDEIFIASSDNYPDALSASPIAAIKGCPILYADSSGKLNAATEDFITGSGCGKITVLGGGSAVPDETVKALEAMGLTVSRVGGADRYATAIAVSSVYESLFDGKAICAATGANYPDALTGAVFAARNKAPVVLVPYNADASNTAVSYIRGGKAEKVYVFGGSAAVSDGTLELIS